MSDNVVAFPGLNDLERDLLELGLTDRESLLKIREMRSRCEEILGFDYLVELLKRAVKEKPIFPEGYDPAKSALPHQYAHQFRMLEERELSLLCHWIRVTLAKTPPSALRTRKELFHLRSEAIRRLEATKKGNP